MIKNLFFKIFATGWLKITSSLFVFFVQASTVALIIFAHG
jgi:hypothetical protein